MRTRSYLALLASLGAAASIATAVPAVSNAEPAVPAVSNAEPAAPAAASCSWLVRSDSDLVNVAYPDTDATYWALAYAAVPGTQLVINGIYPKARYFSFHAYDPTGVPVDSIYDAQIAPDAGSSNPFVAKPARGTKRRYSVTVSFTAAPATPAPNTIYAGSMPVAGAPNPGGILIYRVYVPTDPTSASGDVPLPTVTTETTSGQIISSKSDCSTPQPTTGGAINSRYEKVPSVLTSPTSKGAADPTWARAAGSPYFGFFGNQQNAYLTSSISQLDGEVAVIHGKAMTFPNTGAGQPAWTPSQVRYWSVCENTSETRVVDCAPDYQIPQTNGSYTIVVSPTNDRPTNATAKDGVAWIPWGAEPKGLLIFRTMVPSASFTHAAQNVAAKANAAKVMGAYYPSIRYCSVASYEKSGPDGCTNG